MIPLQLLVQFLFLFFSSCKSEEISLVFFALYLICLFVFLFLKIDDTPLIAASYQFESAPLELLLQKGAIIEAKNKVSSCVRLSHRHTNFLYAIVLS